MALRDVSHTYPARAGQGPVPALGPLDFEFRRGEFVAVVGPSGRGKSTLLEIIAWFNVWDNVAFGLHRDGTDGAEITRRVDQALAFMLLRDEAKKALGVA
ncbi:MAG: ATP-binding cassette domain-containing protein [Xanthobacteraceae bacterium]